MGAASRRHQQGRGRADRQVADYGIVELVDRAG
jgi:hypothetical protein